MEVIFISSWVKNLNTWAGRANCWGEYILACESSRRTNEINKELYELHYSPNRLIRTIKSRRM
jgi:hypothetical protein